MADTINARVARCRKLRDMTQADVAEKLGMKCSTYSQMERKGNISAQMVLHLANIFEIEPDVILYGENMPLRPTVVADPILPQPEPKHPIHVDPPLILTDRETNIIRIIRNLSKDKKEEAISYILSLHNNKK
ncbi:MAG: helix-turn-helix transcriptional regulator [Clostridia bacterium]|nr:helix-turn-helix transcriptional regulator [Clostridia bacterium]